MSSMLGFVGLPSQLSAWIISLDASLALLIFLYVVIVLVLGTIIDSVSIMLITVPIFVTVLEPFNVDLVWFGIVTIIAVEIGLLTPPLGLAVYVIKSTLNRDDISLADIFIGAAPYALTMLIVLTLIIIFPEISLWLVDQAREFRRN